jgi:predicted ABC-type ATPase
VGRQLKSCADVIQWNGKLRWRRRNESRRRIRHCRSQWGGKDDIHKRYTAGVRNLFRRYRPISDGWWLYDASRLPPKLIASEERRHLAVKQKRLYRLIEKQENESHEEEA